MIRTSIVLSPRQNAAERLYLQANGLPVDVTAASQSVVMTSHRPTQLYVASPSGQRQTATTLTVQTGIQGQHMLRLMDILDRQGSDILARLYGDRELNGEWLVALDENRLNAVLSERFQFFLFRSQRLRELRPVARLGEPGAAPDPVEPAGLDAAGDTGPDAAKRFMYHFRIEIRQGDQVLVMPRGLIPPTLQTEAERVLQGMQQLPDRLSALIVRLRERGVTAPASGWLALQVLRTLTEYVATDRPSRPWLAGRRKGADSVADVGYSEEVAGPDGTAVRGPSAGGRSFGRGLGRITGAAGGAAAGAAAGADRTAAAGTQSYTPGTSGTPGAGDERFGLSAALSRRLLQAAVAVALVAILAVAGYLIFKPGSKPPATTTTTTTTAALTSATTTSRPTPTMTPVPTTVATTAARVPWYVIARRLNLRSEPATSGKLIRTLTAGQPVYVLEQTSKDWTKVETPEGETGYVYASYISKDKPAG